MLIRRRTLPRLAAGAMLAGSVTNPTSASATLAAAADIRSFGARGDGITDDAAAIQAAIDSGAPLLTFPPGRFLVGAPLRPRSGQRWAGAGSDQTVLATPRDEATAPFNLVELDGTLERFSLTDLGFEGNVDKQRRRREDGQSAFALYLRGVQRSISLQRCRFEGFGEAAAGKNPTGGGAVVLGPAPDSQAQGLEDILVSECSFRNNGNVPGIYLAGGGAGEAIRRGIRIIGNDFRGVAAGTRPQNCVYVLADNPHARIRDVAISHNLFQVDTAVDACIELNHVEGFSMAGNAISFDGVAEGSSGILLRDGCRGGTINGNSFVNRAAARHVTAIVLLGFEKTNGTIEHIAIDGNTLLGFDWRCIVAGTGTRHLTCSGNHIAADGRRIGEALRIGAAHGVLVHGNTICGADRPVLFATGAADARDIVLAGNLLQDCGRAGSPLVDAEEGARIAALVMHGNVVQAAASGCTGFTTAALAANSFSSGSNFLGTLPAQASP